MDFPVIDIHLGSSDRVKIVWATDLHLDAADRFSLLKFFTSFQEASADIAVISGDISNGSQSLMHLRKLAELITKPLYFVLGNHDYYFGSIHEIRKEAAKLTAEYPLLHYLTAETVVPLTKTTALVGHDGWSDGRAGDFFKSKITLNDYILIDELKNINPAERLQKLHELGEEAAAHVRNYLPKAFADYSQVILVTHPPPFEEACIFEEVQTNADWAPHFVCCAVGDALIEIMENFPDKQLLVLCGHSHSRADVSILPNLRVIAGESELGDPKIQGTIFVD